MSNIREAPDPSGVLYRLGRAPDPLAWAPWRFVGAGRFDDPLGRFRVLYTAQQRRACFVEALAPLRLSLQVLAAEQAVAHVGEPLPGAPATLPPHWLRTRAIGRLRVQSSQHWLDLRALDTREALRAELAPVILRLGLPDLDISAVSGPSRALTQAIARWAHEHEYQGIVYSSRFDRSFDCWAIFEGAIYTPDGPPAPLTRDDQDLRAVAAIFGLAL